MGAVLRPPAAIASSLALSALDRGVTALMASRVPTLVVDRVLESPELAPLVTRTLERPELERLVARALDGPAVDRLVRCALESAGVAQATRSVVESELMAATTDLVLDGEEMQRIVERVASSPEVRDAIAAQSIGLADEVAGEVRSRAMAGDAAAERIALRLLGRRART